jgi:5-methyltetrahydrofolate--homocysteine methyltransferase
MFTKFPFILDGATGTELRRRGMPSGVMTELWVLEHPQEIIELQSAYADAGSMAIYAPTFCCNREALKWHGETSRDIRDLVLSLVELSREAVGGRALIGGDIAPTGLSTPPVGNTDYDELISIFQEQAAALEEANVDFFAIETQMSLHEARAAVLAVKRVSTKPIIVTFACDLSGRTLSGGDLLSAIVTLEDMGIDAFGINCCGDLQVIENTLRRISPYTNLPLIAKPNAGMPITVNGSDSYPMTAAEFAGAAHALMDAGAGVLGGCCGSTPEHIAALADTVRGAAYSVPKRTVAALAASERAIICEGDLSFIEDIVIDDNLPSVAEKLRQNGARALRLNIQDQKQLAILLENQYALTLPICVTPLDGQLKTELEKHYNGKALFL